MNWSPQARWVALAALLVACGGTVRRSGTDGGAGSSASGGSHVDPNPPGKTCEYEGNTYASGDVVPMGECSQCTCADGDITCLLLPCDPAPQVCSYQGNSYPIGASFPAADGCNTCSCEADGGIACTEIGCSNTCETLMTSYVELVEKAASCMKNEECIIRVPSYLPCGCDRWIATNDMTAVYQVTMLQDQYKMQCAIDDGCPVCPPLQQTGYCVKGSCVSEVWPK